MLSGVWTTYRFALSHPLWIALRVGERKYNLIFQKIHGFSKNTKDHNTCSPRDIFRGAFRASVSFDKQLLEFQNAVASRDGL